MTTTALAVPPGYYVRFYHKRRIKKCRCPHNCGTEHVQQNGGKTICVVHNEETRLPEVITEAKCRKNEKFSRKLGREISLGRALKSLDEKLHPERYTELETDDMLDDEEAMAAAFLAAHGIVGMTE